MMPLSWKGKEIAADWKMSNMGRWLSQGHRGKPG